MAFFKSCNCFKEPPSSDDSPVRLRDAEDSKRRFTISTNCSSAQPSANIELPSKPIHDIFYSTDESTIRDIPHTAQFNLRRRESLQAIHNAASKIKIRLSRDPTEGLGKKRKSEREELRSGITDTRSVLQDMDAEAIKTLDDSGTRHDSHSGSIQMSTQAPKRTLSRSSTLSPQLGASQSTELQHIVEPSPTRVKRIVLSNMLADRASKLDDQTALRSDDRAAEAANETALDKRKKYVFSDFNSTNASASKMRSIRTSFSQQAADMKPRRFSTMSSCVAETDVSRTTQSQVSRDTGTIETVPQTPEEDYSPPIAANNQRRPSWMRGASGAFGDSRRASVSSRERIDRGPGDEEAHSGGVDCNGSGAHTRSHSDGSSRAMSCHLYNMHISQRLASSGGHLMPAFSSPQLRTGSSSSFSFGPSPDYFTVRPARRVSSSGLSSSKVPIACISPRRNGASSVYTTQSSSKVRGNSGIPSSQASSIPPSVSRSSPILGQSAINVLQPSGRHAFEQLAETCPWSGQIKGLQEKVHIAKTRKNHRSMDMSELSTTQAGSHRSKSLSTAEIAHAEGDNLHQRARILASTRYFSQADLHELSWEVAKRTLPRGRRISQYDGSNDAPNLLQPTFLAPDYNRRLSSASASRGLALPSRSPSIMEMSPSRKPSVVAGIDPIGASVWDNALREHVREDARLRGKRPGSMSTDPVSRRSQMKSQATMSSLGPLSSLGITDCSTGEDQDQSDLQAHLSAYKIRQSSSSHGDRPKISSHYRVSSSDSTSSWSRFPAHTRLERIDSPATEQDNVFSRDFAPPLTTPLVIGTSLALPTVDDKSSGLDNRKKTRSPARQFKSGIKKARSSQIIRMKKSLRGLVRARSHEMAGKLAVDDARGHRSSVSEGVGGSMTEYPELEMLSPLPLSPTLESAEGGYFLNFEQFVSRPKIEVSTAMDGAAEGKGAQKAVAVVGDLTSEEENASKGPTKRAKKTRKRTSGRVGRTVQALEQDNVRSFSNYSARTATSSKSSSRGEGARQWGKLYESCVQLPSFASPTVSPGGSMRGKGYIHGRAVGEHFLPLYMDLGSGEGQGGGGQYELRASTLDFGRELEEEAAREKGRLCGAEKVG